MTEPESDAEEIVAMLEKFSGSEDLSTESVTELKAFVRAPDLDSSVATEKAGEIDLENAEATDLRARLAEMGVPGRIKLALFGNAVCRALLIRDGNKLIPQFVLKNPKIQLKEIEEFSKNPYLSDAVLRSIADSRSYMKSAIVKYNLVTNPKTPQDVALKWLRYLQSHEIKRISKSKNVPQLIATTAKKLAGD